MSAKKTVRELIIEGRLETAVQELLHQVDHEPDLLAHPDYESLHDRAVNIMSRLNEQKNEEGLGIDDEKERNRIRLSLIDLDRDVGIAQKGERILSEVPKPKISSDDSSGRRSSALLYGIVGGVAIAIVAFILLGRNKGNDPAPPPDRDTGEEQVDNSQPNSEPKGDLAPDGEGDSDSRVRTLQIFPDRSATGSMVSNGNGPRFPLRFGDTEQNREIRAYLSFPLDRIPDGAQIERAELFVSRSGGDYREMRRAIVEEVNIGDDLTQDDFDANRSPIAILRSDSLMSQQLVRLDVTDKFELVTLYDRPFFTLQFRPDEIIRNRKSDQLEIRNGQNMTRLEVEFKLN
ncbi:MAG: hypothetical protein AAF544_04635 [Bacteroidota bacterium]